MAGVRREYAHLTDAEFAAGRAAVLRDLLDRLEPLATLSTAVLEAAAALAEAPARRREAAALPFLRLLGLACVDGLLRRAGRQAGALADRYEALSGFHGTGASGQAALLAAQCRRDDLDAAFDLVFPEAGALPGSSRA